MSRQSSAERTLLPEHAVLLQASQLTWKHSVSFEVFTHTLHVCSNNSSTVLSTHTHTAIAFNNKFAPQASWESTKRAKAAWPIQVFETVNS